MTEETKETHWEDKDELCPTCGKVIKQAKGWNKQNAKKLLRIKPTGTEWIIIFFMILFILGSLAYKHDTSVCREFAANFSSMCSSLVNIPNSIPK